mmetsp:Transcript_41631/g.58592  ORF Transcript_41631/g.58592 Transcript_41631/m.58592 type:complete len:102 (+) Transcript_41631:1-306(+)
MFAKMKNLREISLSSCTDMKGSIPSVLGSLTQLERVRFDSMDITGTIPSELALAPLNLVALAYTRYLIGSVPTEFCSVPSLEIISVSSRIPCSCSTCVIAP